MTVRIAFLILVFALAGRSFSATDLDAWSSDASRMIKTRVDNHWTMGIVAGVIDADGQRVVGYGRLAADSDKSPDGDTLFEVGSITKVFTGLLLADMSIKGELKLTDPLEMYLPAGSVVPNKDGKKVTLVSLAHHNSGFPRGPADFNADPLHREDFTPKDLYAWLAAWKPETAPGEKYLYSNLGFATLGQALSLKAATDYESLLRKRILDPLKLNDTRVKIPADVKNRFASGYDQIFQPAANVGDASLPGAGAMSSTVNDLLKLVSAAMGQTKTPIDNVITLSMGEREKTDKANQWRGLGWHIDILNGKEFIWKNGQTAGYNAFLGFLPDSHKGVVILSNTRSEINDIAVHLLDEKSPLDKFKDKPRKEHAVVKIQPQVLSPYAGQYEPDSKKTCTISIEDGHLFVQSKNQPKVELLAESDTTFICAMPAEVTFRRDDQGRVSSFLFHNEMKDEPDVVFKKINDKTEAP